MWIWARNFHTWMDCKLNHTSPLLGKWIEIPGGWTVKKQNNQHPRIFFALLHFCWPLKWESEPFILFRILFTAIWSIFNCSFILNLEIFIKMYKHEYWSFWNLWGPFSWSELLKLFKRPITATWQNLRP